MWVFFFCASSSLWWNDFLSAPFWLKLTFNQSSHAKHHLWGLYTVSFLEVSQQAHLRWLNTKNPSPWVGWDWSRWITMRYHEQAPSCRSKQWNGIGFNWNDTFCFLKDCQSDLKLCCWQFQFERKRRHLWAVPFPITHSGSLSVSVFDGQWLVEFQSFTVGNLRNGSSKESCAVDFISQQTEWWWRVKTMQASSQAEVTFAGIFTYC